MTVLVFSITTTVDGAPHSSLPCVEWNLKMYVILDSIS